MMPTIMRALRGVQVVHGAEAHLLALEVAVGELDEEEAQKDAEKRPGEAVVNPLVDEAEAGGKH
jgi:hypothetical protein